MKLERLIETAQEKELPDLVLKNGKIVNVFTGEIIDGDVAITDGIIVGTGEYHGKSEKDVQGKYIVPGFINAHVHVESSIVTPPVYSYEELKWGTTTIITDPHEIANVGGIPSLENILRAAEKCPVNYYVMLPSCVPSTPFEHAGAILKAKDLAKLKDNSNVLGLGELMNVVGTLDCYPEIMKKVEEFSDKIIDGHAPMTTGKALNAYVTAGVHTDHESITYDEAAEKLRCGMAVLVREGSASKNLADIIQGVVESGIDTSRMAFCTDDKHLADIRKEGTIRANIKKAVSLGLSPVKAIQMATINAANIYGLKKIGAVACGYKADIVVLDDLQNFNVTEVYKNGIPLENIPEPFNIQYNQTLLKSVNVGEITEKSFRIPIQYQYSVIGIIENQIATTKIEMSHRQIEKGMANGTLRKISVIERHHARGYITSAYICGYGLKHGAIATTVAHDSHNIIVIGDNDKDMFKAVEVLKRINGGYVIIKDGEEAGVLPLELGGLMSLKNADEFIPELDAIIQKAYEMGVNKNIDPFITLSFMALPVIPEIRITDCGLFDVTKFEFI